MTVAAFKRSGLHRLECESCAGYAYGTVACLERYGLPACGCGARLLPARVELAMLLGVDCLAVAEYQHELSSVMHGQAPHGQRARELRPAELVAAERVEQRRRERARASRLGALLPAAERWCSESRPGQSVVRHLWPAARPDDGRPCRA